MGGRGSGTAQATPLETRIFNAQMDAFGELRSAREDYRRAGERLDRVEAHIRRANSDLVRLVYRRDTLTDLEAS